MERDMRKAYYLSILMGIIPLNGYADTRLIVQFGASSPHKTVNASLNSDAQANREVLAERLEKMHKLSHNMQNKISVAVGYPIKDVEPFALGGRIIQFDGDLTQDQTEEVIARLKRVPGIASVSVDERVSAFNVDSIDPHQWDMMDSSPNAAVLVWGLHPYFLSSTGGDIWYGSSFYNNTQKSWINNLGNGVIVAVIDSGYVPHPDFKDHLQPLDDGSGLIGYTFMSDCRMAGECPTSQSENTQLAPHPGALDLGTGVTSEEQKSSNWFFTQNSVATSTWHGTAVTGIIIGQRVGNNSIAGGAPGAKVVPVRVMGKGGGHASDIINGMMWAANLYPGIENKHPAHVINLSLGFSGPCVQQSEMQKAIDDIAAQGITIVTAAGNSGANVANFTPPSCKNVISVAAMKNNQQLASYSNFGEVTIGAPGGGGQSSINIYTTTYKSTLGFGNEARGCSGNECYGYDGAVDGTSIAAPHVTAVVADLLSINPQLTPKQIYKIIQDSGNHLSKEYACTGTKCIFFTPFNNPNNICANLMLASSNPQVKCDSYAGSLNAAKAIELVHERKF